MLIFTIPLCWEMNTILHILILIHTLFSSECEADEIATGKPTCCTNAIGRESFHLTDEDWDTVTQTEGRGEEWDALSIDLAGVYRLNYIELWSQDSWYMANDGIGVPMNVYVAAESYSPCTAWEDFPTWTVCAEGVQFQQKGDDVYVECGGAVGRYIIVSSSSPRASKHDKGRVVLAEITADGSKISNAPPYTSISSEPASLPLDRKIQQTQEALLRNVFYFTINSYSANVLANLYNQYALTKSGTGKNIIVAGEEGAGRYIFIARFNGNEELLNNEISPTLLENIYAWFGKTASNVVSSNFDAAASNSLLSLTQFDKFDVNAVFQRLQKGEISLIVSAAGWYGMSVEVGQLLDKLNLVLTNEISNYTPEIAVPTKVTIETLNMEAALKHACQNRHVFSKFKLDNLNELSDEKRANIEKIINAEQFQKTIKDCLQSMEPHARLIAPCREKPFLQSTNNGLDKLFMTNFNNLWHYERAGKLSVIPGVSYFPGNFENVNPVDGTIEVKITDVKQWYSTGFYAKPGEIFKFEILSSSLSSSDGLYFFIGCHTDDLSHLGTLYRWPKITERYWLKYMSSGEIPSHTGGIIYLYSKEEATLKIRLQAVYKYKQIYLQDANSISKWDSSSNEIPWSEIGGDVCSFCLPTKKIMNEDINTLQTVAQTYNNVVKVMKNFFDFKNDRGFNQKIAVDIQIKFGAAHSGYPIVLTYDWLQDLLDVDKTKSEGYWGIYHEIGHNFQNFSYTSTMLTEISNNIFCMVIEKELFKFNNLALPSSYRGLNSMSDTVNFWNSATDGSFPSTNEIGLSFFAHLMHYFGPGLMNRVFLSLHNSGISYVSEADKLANLLITISKEARFNLAPFYELYKIKLSSDTKSQLQSIGMCFLPDDEFTRLAGQSMEMLKAKYGHGCLSTGSYKPDYATNILLGVDQVAANPVTQL